MPKPLDRTGPVVLISTASTDSTNPPVIIESPHEAAPPVAEEHLWRPATDEEYAAYVAYWDHYYDSLP